MASNWAEVYLNLSEKAQNKKDYTQAIALLDTALVWDAKYQPALIAYAGVKQAQNLYSEAEEWLQRAKQVNDKYAPIYLAEAELLEAQRRNGKLEQQEAVQKQVLLYQKALELEDDLLMRALANQRFREFYLSYGLVPDAIAVAESYVKDAPTVSTYLRDRRDEALAFASWLKGTSVQGPEAEQELARLVALKPQNYELRRQYAEVLAAQGKYKEATATLEEAQRILTAAGNPRADYILLMAKYKLQLQDKAGAEATAKPLLEGKANLRGEPYLLAGLYADLGLTGKAEEIIKQQPQPATKYEKALQYFAEARILESKEKIRKAVKTYKKALEELPYNLEIRNRLVNLLQQKGKTKEAQTVQNFGKERITS